MEDVNELLINAIVAAVAFLIGLIRKKKTK